jgi:hypothetical protein
MASSRFMMAASIASVVVLEPVPEMILMMAEADLVS